MIRGFFIDNSPFIEVLVAWGQSVQAPVVILDTGFTGDLQVTPEIATELNLEITGVIPVELASGRVEQTPTALAVASMEGKNEIIEVLISKSIPLAGISFLTKFSYKAIVDCKNKKVTLRKA